MHRSPGGCAVKWKMYTLKQKHKHINENMPVFADYNLSNLRKRI